MESGKQARPFGRFLFFFSAFGERGGSGVFFFLAGVFFCLLLFCFLFNKNCLGSPFLPCGLKF